MKSQAQFLQERVEAARRRHAHGEDDEPRAQTICVTSGKGGVGKTAFSINFAISLAQCGKRVVVMDGDFGFSNVNVMLGRNSEYTLEHVVRKEKKLSEVMAESYPNVWYISGGSGVNELISLGERQLAEVLDQLAALEREMDFIIFDTGAGINANILQMIQASDRTILVTTPEPTSVLDSYVVLKSAAELEERPEMNVLINKANNEKEAQTTFDSLSGVAGNNLGYKVNILGYLPMDAKFTKSIKAMVPFVLQYPLSGASIQLKRIAQMLTNPQNQAPATAGSRIKGFFDRLRHGRKTN